MQNPEFLMPTNQNSPKKNTEGHPLIESPIALLKKPLRIQLLHSTYIQNVFTTQHVFVMTLVYAETRTSSAAFWALD